MTASTQKDAWRLLMEKRDIQVQRRGSGVKIDIEFSCDLFGCLEGFREG